MLAASCAARCIDSDMRPATALCSRIASLVLPVKPCTASIDC